MGQRPGQQVRVEAMGEGEVEKAILRFLSLPVAIVSEASLGIKTMKRKYRW